MRKNEEVTLPRTGCGDGCVINGHGIGQQCIMAQLSRQKFDVFIMN